MLILLLSLTSIFSYASEGFVFDIQRGNDLLSWEKVVAPGSIDKNLFVILEDMSEGGNIPIPPRELIDYDSREGLDKLFEVLAYFKASELSPGLPTFKQALDQVKKDYNQLPANQIQQSLIWSETLGLQPELVTPLRNALFDQYTDALLRTDFTKIKRDEVRYYLPLTIDNDKAAAKKLVGKILKTYFSDKNKNWDIEFQEHFIEFKKGLIKKMDKRLVLFLSLESSARLSIPIEQKYRIDWFAFENVSIADLCWVQGLDKRWKITQLFNKYVAEARHEAFDDKHIITIGADGFVRLYNVAYQYDGRVVQTANEGKKLRLKEFNVDVTNLKAVIVSQDYKAGYKLNDAAIVSDATGAIYLGFGNTLYTLRVENDDLMIKGAVTISDKPAQISALSLNGDAIAVTYKHHGGMDVLLPWENLREQYVCYKITGNNFSRYKDKPVGFDTLQMTCNILQDDEITTKKKTFLVPYDGNLVSIADVIHMRGFDEFYCYDTLFDEQNEKIFTLTEDRSNEYVWIFVRKYNVIPPQLSNWIKSLNEKAKKIRQDELILQESLAYDALLYIHQNYKKMAPQLKIGYSLKSNVQKISAIFTANPVTNFYRYLRNSYFALGGDKKRELQGKAFLLLAGSTFLALLAFAIREDINASRSMTPKRIVPQDYLDYFSGR